MNHMEQVANMLEVDLNERFKIDIDENISLVCYLTNNGLVVERGEFLVNDPDILCDIICGRYTIRRNTWNPKEGDHYWYVTREGYAYKVTFSSCSMDRIFYKLGNCYRTKEEAERNIDKWVTFYVSDEVLSI